ncbi:MAG: hypothetical protein B1H08_04320 [Candidatus Omnitrophica bacterium 4484_171]|nr:MAG: hypothetical protein B1H08_04320 [Candidatus Omnitrophica bacterium 4484_171]
MRYKKVPKTDMEVSAVSLGTWAIGGRDWGKADDKESISTIQAAADFGINFIDTAPIYGRGHSEEIIGKAIKGIRSKFYIATKCGIQPEGKGFTFNLKPEAIAKELEDSLKRLGIETIDIYQCHYPDPHTPIEDTLGQLLKFKKQGKVRYIGVSNFDLSLLEKASSITAITTLQVQYSLLDRSIEKGVLSFCSENDIGVIAYGPLGGGILTGKYINPPRFPKGDARSFFYPYYKEPYWSKIQVLIGEIKNIARKRNKNPAEVALNWVNQQEGIAVTIAGCRNYEQLSANASAGSWELSLDELERLRKISDGLELER